MRSDRVLSWRIRNEALEPLRALEALERVCSFESVLLDTFAWACESDFGTKGRKA